jgi:hypothetical protein
MVHYSNYLSSICSLSFHYSTYFSSVVSKSFHYSTYFSSIISIWKVSWVVKKYGKYGRKLSWIVKWFRTYGRKESCIVKWYGKDGRNASWIMKRYGNYACLPSIFSKSFHYTTQLLPYFPYLFTIQLTFLP